MSARACDLFLRKQAPSWISATMNVRIDRGMVAAALKLCPSSFTLTPRNPAHAVQFGGNDVVFTLVAGPPNVHDCERGRRSGNLNDYKDFIRLTQYFNAIHMMGNQVVAPSIAATRVT